MFAKTAVKVFYACPHASNHACALGSNAALTIRERVIVLDFGAEYAQKVARKVRELGVYCEIMPFDTFPAALAKRNCKAVILSDGHFGIHDSLAPMPDPTLFDSGLPILGIGYGMQVMCHANGGRVGEGDCDERGKTTLELAQSGVILDGWDKTGQVWMDRGDAVIKAPPGFTVIARTAGCPVAAMANVKRKMFGVQFRPELQHTAGGDRILSNFLAFSRIERTWTMKSFAEEAKASIKEKVKGVRVVSALSGGVDSMVASLLVYLAIGENLTGVFVDHGLLREGEVSQVQKTLYDRFKMNVTVIDARERFLRKLSGVEDPEAKRKIIGNEFIRVFEEEARRLGDVRFLVQGTLYPDVIESGTKTSATIKSHHNVGGLPDNMELELIEPLRELFKDEVRALGKEIGLPDDIVWRQPFPGPGLAVRIIGEATPERLDIVRGADAIVREEIGRAGLARNIWQYFAVLTGVRSVGVVGDERTYGHTVAVRAVNSEDAVTADWAKIPYDVLDRISTRITREIKGVSRVVYDITSKPPSTIEWE